MADKKKNKKKEKKEEKKIENPKEEKKKEKKEEKKKGEKPKKGGKEEKMEKKPVKKTRLEVEVTGESENKLLGRKEVFFEIGFEGGSTPTRQDVREKIVATINSDPGLTVLMPLRTRFGRGFAKGSVHVYEDEEQMREVCQKHLLVRSGLVKKEGEKK